MSIKALTWAMSQPVRPATKKIVLIAMGDCAGGTHDDLAFPCIQTITEKTSLNRKTAISMIEKLVNEGLLIDTNQRTGATKQIPVYRLPIWDNSPKNGTVPFLPSNSPKNGFKQSRFYHQTVPKTGHVPVLSRLLPKESNLNDPLPISAEDIYGAYPLKVGKPKAISAIKKAMLSTSPQKLLDLTMKYSAARAGNLEFVPHPSTWFNQERFNDDPQTWIPKTNGNGHSKFSTAIRGNADRKQMSQDISVRAL